MNDCPIHDGTATGMGSGEPLEILALVKLTGCLGCEVSCGNDLNAAGFPQIGNAENGATQARGTFNDGIEYWLCIRRRLTNNVEDFAGGGLLLSRLG